jgi:hypothetical protein
MKLPVGIQSFSDLRRNDYLYIDKTAVIHRMITSGKVFFLSRPRRFGKSLLVSTLDALFRGDKSLFEGLYIYDKVNWDESYPVIKLDWSNIAHTSAEDMEKGILNQFAKIANSYHISLAQDAAINSFSELIVSLFEKTGKQVAVLIDEYDMPILDSLNKSPETTNSIRDFLQSFYKSLKGSDEYIRFIFLTGLSKFSKTSIFSGLNNLRDITLSAEYSAICGYTQEELENYFDAHINQFSQVTHASRQDAINSIRFWYNGFSWDGMVAVYNPFSILLLFSENEIRNYWFETGTPTFLIELIKERNDIQLLLEPCKMQASESNSFDYSTLDTKLLLFQTGYLTIKQIEKSLFDDERTYILGLPNEEVRRSLMQYLISSFALYPAANTGTMRNQMLKQLFEGDISAFEASAKELFAHIPYQLHIAREAYYHSLLLVWLNMLGFNVDAEVSTDKGRIDAVWTWEDRIVITEIKYAPCGETEPLLKDALDQIRDRRYYERYTGTNRKIIFLAIAFAGREIACKTTDIAA